MSNVVDHAVRVLKDGGLIGLPTETVYGLGANAENDDAVRRIYAVKGRPLGHPLIVHLAPGALDGWVHEVDLRIRCLAEAFWPGPLTIIAKRGLRAHDLVTGGEDTVGIRIPSHPLALDVLKKFGGGIAAPSANRFGSVSPTTADHVKTDLGNDVDFVLDGGPCTVGVESTIFDCTSKQGRILRPGAISQEALEDMLGEKVQLATHASDVRAPGLLASHYAPNAEVRIVDPAELTSAIAHATHAKLRFDVLDLRASQAPLEQLAQALYAELRRADEASLAQLIVTLPQERGLGVAIADRLRKAAGPRTIKT